MSTIDSTKISGMSILLCANVVHISYGIYVATLDDLRKTGQLFTRLNSTGKGMGVAPHSIQLIDQWARARGYTKERHVIKKKDRRRIR